MTFTVIDRRLKEVRFIATLHDTKHWIECYLHQENLFDKEFTVVERINVNSRGGNNDFVSTGFDTLAEAEACYALAEARVKAAIVKALR